VVAEPRLIGDEKEMAVSNSGSKRTQIQPSFINPSRT
jgi:hypothetical protein